MTSTRQSLRGPCQPILQDGPACHYNLCSSNPTCVCPSYLESSTQHTVMDGSNQLVIDPIVTMSTYSYTPTLTSSSMTMTMASAPMTNFPLSLPFPAAYSSRADRAFSGPVVLVTDTNMCSSRTTPAAPSLTPPATLQQSSFAAPRSGHCSTVNELVVRSSLTYNGDV